MKFRRQLLEGMIRALLGAVVCTTVACGGGDDSGSNGAGGTGSAGGGGKGNVDSVPPEFAGLDSAKVDADGSVELAWTAASDNESMADNIAYAIYLGDKAGAEDFSNPYLVTPAGATGATLTSVVPGQNHFWVVRAVDQSGNEDDNTVEKSASPDDTTAPRFAGVTLVTEQSSRSILVQWKPAEDDASSAAHIKYEIFLSSSPDPKSFTFNKPNSTAQGAVTSAVVGKLEPESSYYVIVRAVDAAGNADQNTHVVSVSTQEGQAPVFAGLKQVNPTPSGVKLYWLPASDNLSDVASIVYNVYVTTETTFSAQDLAKPAFVTPQGAITFIVPGLINQQKYSFLVRAQDTAGNEDGNTAVLSARALNGADDTAPGFNGDSVKVIGDSPSTLRVTWTAGSDIVTDQGHLLYNVFVSATADPPPADASPTLVSAPGATSIEIAGLPAAVTRYVTVRCRDQAGNSLPNVSVKSGSTLAAPNTDITAPVFAAPPVPSTNPALPAGLHLTWSNASDDTSGAAKIRYLVCASTVETDCLGASFLEHIYSASGAGATQLDLTGLLTRTRYFVYLRAQDEAGNLSTTDEGAAVTTPTSYSRDVSPIIFDKCNGCHNFGVLSTVNVEGGYVDSRLPSSTTGMFLVAPGNPRDSLLYRRINPLGDPIAPFDRAITNLYRGPQEPQNSAKIFTGPLSGDEDGAIRDWITQGANAN